ncbi:hypothetical protein [Sutcliffiella horikoshii]|uniref:hypothetical protein n=1 Tax=Sutcliffiella horikoshii TaxID=79883 RepID=UPI001F334029|nr:hypothetical protein [Sutcliffiella horikoshii]MCG1023421.1 hypothetical protein [Sutcliffiella horikoshii]
MRRMGLLLFYIAVLVLGGCSYTATSVNYLNVTQGDLSKEILAYFESVEADNGAHLYMDNANNSMFVYFNSSNVVQGEKAEILTDFDVDIEKDVLNILYTSEETTDLSSSSSEHSRIYRVNLNKEYDIVKLFHNGKEVSFRSVSGGE